MRTGIIPLRRFVPVFLVLVILSCDSFKEDFIQPENQITFNSTEYYILPGTSTLIDQKSIIKESFTDISFSISQKPTRGTLSPLDTFLIVYRPGPGFTEGEDQFVVSISSKGKVLTTKTVIIFMKERKEDFACALYSVEDKVIVKSEPFVAIQVLNNDRLCGANNISPQVSLHSNPRFGQATLQGDSIVVYKPGPAYAGYDEFVYKITDSAGDESSYGIITIVDGTLEILDIPMRAWKILFIDERIGFLLGDSLYRTIDGGESWRRISYPQDSRFPLADVFFVDASNGFLATSYGPLMHTMDGGMSWKFVDERNTFDLNPVESVFFTSLSTGFVITSGDWSYDSDFVNHNVYKTVDSGKTWKEVFPTADGGYVSIVFTAADIGYAFQQDNIFITTDAGESWKLLFKYQGLRSAVATEEHLFAILTIPAGTDLVHKSPDGLTWKPVGTSMQFAHSLDFSPSGDLGLAAGWRIFDELPWELPDPVASSKFSLIKTIDKGETWTPVYPELYGIPRAIEIPSSKVAYILCEDKLVKYTP